MKGKLTLKTGEQHKHSATFQDIQAPVLAQMHHLICLIGPLQRNLNAQK